MNTEIPFELDRKEWEAYLKFGIKVYEKDRREKASIIITPTGIGWKIEAVNDKLKMREDITNYDTW
jgi:hypothetical protein